MNNFLTIACYELGLRMRRRASPTRCVPSVPRCDIENAIRSHDNNKDPIQRLAHPGDTPGCVPARVSWLWRSVVGSRPNRSQIQ
jgi:hypothetical protein